MQFSEEDKTKVLNALREPEYDWRTIDGISSELRLPSATVQVILDYLSDDVVRSSRPDSKGRALFTTRDRYYGHLGRRVLTALTDRIL